jgi:DNA/RNA-binding domain of Phe-tRNA-synthetase-like protein
LIDVALSPELAGRVKLGILVLEGVTVHEHTPSLSEEIAAESRALRERYASVKSADVPGAAEARSLYKALGLDPTKTRPSNEALMRRVLKGEALYRVNTLVDALNLASLRHQLPFGLYDLDHVHPPVFLRMGRPGESYEGIRKGDVNVEARPVLVDGEGAFGNPTSDSARTCITLATRNALVAVYAPAGLAPARLDGVMKDTTATLIRASGGALRESRVVA